MGNSDDDSYKPNVSSDSNDSDNEPTNKKAKKSTNNKKTQYRRKNSTAISNKSSPVRISNYDTFFVNDVSESSDIEKIEAVGVDEESSEKQENSNGSSHIEIIEVDILNESNKKQENSTVENLSSSHLNQMQNEIKEIKIMLQSLTRQVAKIEVLLKYQKPQKHIANDMEHTDEDFIQKLESYGLPVSSKSKLDEIEKCLSNKEYKSKLV